MTENNMKQGAGKSITEIDEQYVAHTYARFPLELVSGKGSLVADSQGREYIDLGSGIAVTSFGVADDEWLAAITEQAGRIQHASNLYYTEPCARLAQMLCERTGMKRVFFSNSGAEANECAIKAARKYGAERHGAECTTIITLQNSFHGRTLTTLAATGQDAFHQLFTPLTPGFVSVPANDLQAMLDAVDACGACGPAGIMIELIQGEGGVNVLDPAYVADIAKLCAERDIALVVDEVQTGNGRTGSLYAFQEYGILPDIVSTAKGLAGGLPLGATMLGEKVKDIFAPGDNGSTFGGNPVAAAGALSILSRIDDALLAEVREKSRMVFEALSGAPGIEGVCGMGLMIGVKTTKPAAEVITACREAADAPDGRGVLVLSAKGKVRLLPALNIPAELLAEALELLKAACA